MAKEITVTFQNGGVFNGVANSYTFNGETTYYFDIDKRYRVVVTDEQLVSQQYQNTNGAWYNINTIIKVEIKDISSGSDITIEYLEKNYYNKDESDKKYVKKSGDTMTGSLIFDYSDYKLSLSNTTITLSTGGEPLLQLYKNFINIYQNGSLAIRSGDYSTNIMAQLGYYALSFNTDAGLTSTRINRNGIFVFNADGEHSRTAMTTNGYYIYDNNFTVCGQFVQENNYTNTALHIFNNGRVVLHNGAPSTTEAYVQYQGSGITGYNGAIVFFNTDVTLKGNTICTSMLRANNGVESHGPINVISSNINLTNGSNAYYISANYLYFAVSNIKRYEQTPDGIDMYNSAGVTLHSGAPSTTETYLRLLYNSMTLYNASSNYTFNMNMNNARFEVSNAYTILMNAYNLISATAGTTLTLTDSGGAIVVKNIIQALNNAFYGEEFLNALNKVFLFIFNKIGGAVYYEFPSQDYGGGFVAGGGSSRGGGVGRR